jgi:NADH-quinone oxidoreductase subunit J
MLMPALANLAALASTGPSDASGTLGGYWSVAIASVLGFVAVYLLLPRARRFPAPFAAIAAATALVVVGGLLIQVDVPAAEAILFYAFSGLAIVFAGLMLAQSNPVHAALSFAMVVLSTCGLFLLQAAPFLMAATIIIYAGAIVVTFLFVIMLAQQTGPSDADQRSREPFLAAAAGFILLGCLLCVLLRTYPNLGPYLDRAALAARANNVAQWKAILGDGDDFFSEFHTLVHRTVAGRQSNDSNHASIARANLPIAIEEAQRQWNALKPSPIGEERKAGADQLKEFQAQMTLVVELGNSVRAYQGTLQPAAQLPLSSFGGPPANQAIALDERGMPQERLPAANVAGLGKSLFTDNLLAVELAGTLLLVAVVGAIAIAGRRPEGLR